MGKEKSEMTLWVCDAFQPDREHMKKNRSKHSDSNMGHVECEGGAHLDGKFPYTVSFMKQNKNSRNMKMKVLI